MRPRILFITFISIFLFSSGCFGQIRIKMQKEGGVYKVPCVVNGLRLKFIFDTGASSVSISLSEANLMLENGYLDKKDIVGKGQSQTADGSIINNTKIILRKIEINGLVLENVEAIVVNKLKAPLLLGQTAIRKLGRIEINGSEIIVMDNAKSINNLDVNEISQQAYNLYSNKMFIAAAELYEKLYDQQQLSDEGLLMLAKCHYYADDSQKALAAFLRIQDKSIGSNATEININKFSILCNIGVCYYDVEDYENAVLYLQKSFPYINDDFDRSLFHGTLGKIYYKSKKCWLMKDHLDLALKFFMTWKGYSFPELAIHNIKDANFANKIYVYSYMLIDCGYKSEGNYLMAFSANQGDQAAIDHCLLYAIPYNKNLKD